MPWTGPHPDWKKFGFFLFFQPRSEHGFLHAAFIPGFPALDLVICPNRAIGGISRVYLGLHYPSDLLGGYALGAFIGYCVWLGVEKCRAMMQNKLVHLKTAPRKVGRRVAEKKREKNLLAPSTLYLVATPIGNLEDMTFRALKILKEASLIAAEDTRNTLKLLTHFGIKPSKLISCFEHNEVKRVEEILQELEQGGTVALATDAGMPGISVPGFRVVKAVLEKGYKVVPVPGASAVLAALPASGFPATPFTFLGFLPSSPAERRSSLMQLKSEERTLAFYESPTGSGNA